MTPHAAATSDPNHLVPLMLAQMDALERASRSAMWSTGRRGTDQGRRKPVGTP